jgi:hypothetical protein
MSNTRRGLPIFSKHRSFEKIFPKLIPAQLSRIAARGHIAIGSMASGGPKTSSGGGFAVATTAGSQTAISVSAPVAVPLTPPVFYSNKGKDADKPGEVAAPPSDVPTAPKSELLWRHLQSDPHKHLLQERGPPCNLSQEQFYLENLGQERIRVHFLSVRNFLSKYNGLGRELKENLADRLLLDSKGIHENYLMS